MKKYEKELMNTKSKYELQFIETITDNYKKRQAIQFFENGFGISVINIKSHNGIFLSYTQSEEFSINQNHQESVSNYKR